MKKTLKVNLIMFIIFLAMGSFFINSSLTEAVDTTPVSIHFNVETVTGSMFNDEITSSTCTTPNNPTPTLNGFCLFDDADLTIDSTWFPWGVLVNSINGAVDPSSFWLWFLNGDIAPIGIDSYVPEDGDTVLWTLGVQPLKVTVSTTSPTVGETVTVTVKGFDTNFFDFVPIAGAVLENFPGTTDASGVATITPTSPNPINFTVSADGFITSAPVTITPLVPYDITLKIYSSNTVLYDGPKTVTPCAESPEIGAPININGKCAIEQSGLSNSWTWYDSNFHTVSSLPKTLGILDELGGHASDNTNFIYWGWFSNLNYGTVALNKHLLSDGEELLLTYNSYPLRISASKNSAVVDEEIIFTVEEKSTFSPDFSDMVWTSSTDATVTLGAQSCTTGPLGTCSIVLNTTGQLSAVGSKTLYVPSSSLNIEVSSNNGTGVNQSPTFSTTNAITYLKSAQNTDGSFGNSDLYADWAAIAYSAMNVSGSPKNNLLAYLDDHNKISSLLTDNERRVMALLALGKNPYSFNGKNYIKAITDEFDGTGLGDVHLDNDDIFGLIVLPKVGYKVSDDIISKTISLVLSAQMANGSWDNSVDMTAAAIQSLAQFSSVSGVSNALSKAELYIVSKQESDGGWGNVFSTSWAMQAENTLGASWIKNGKTGLDYLAVKQTNANHGGALLPNNETLENNIWATSYAIVAGLGKPWNMIMKSFSKPTNQDNSDDSIDTLIKTDTIIETEIPNPILPTDETNIAVNNTLVAKQNNNNSLFVTNTNLDKTLPNIETHKITPETLTATAVNTLPEGTSNNIPIVVGGLSILTLLYAGLKFWKFF